MRLLIVVPPHTKSFWLRAVAKNVSTKHSGVVVIGPVDDRLDVLFNKYGIPVVYPPNRGQPTTWFGKLLWVFTPRWDPIKSCDTVMIMLHQNDAAPPIIHKANEMGKKLWVVRMVD